MNFPENTVTPAIIEDFIKSENFFTAEEGVIGGRLVDDPEDPTNSYHVPSPLSLVTFCVLTLKNGFTVTGQSACADPAKFNAEIGQSVALGNAKEQIWPLLGFMLRDQLDQVQKAPKASNMLQNTHVGQKVVHAEPMTRASYNRLRGWELPADENGADAGYLVEYTDGGQSNVEGYTGYVSWSPKDVFQRAYGAPVNPPQA